MSKTIAFAKHRHNLVNTNKLCHLQKFYCVNCVDKKTYNRYRYYYNVSFNNPILTEKYYCNICGNKFNKEYKQLLNLIK